ncbi:nucleotidyl transferase AbiEii/AbiGii toxin family protein [Geobacter sulfurreducens]|uniref:nucleotidyl transferase AbiEii/AbiGii toxin family protein n=1 Tax=Geobacter sulfurreducens TaxID=35554 RepID=UPI001BDDB15E|nr:nucleotidyl transferase AbiEii/AbiGii toxin family protein [Geobacter sulfurreducens]QVW35179.1 nucleotidyl transferase AbiEii/AbiGii toxin family protein [Geobacter sulfurreducens]
MIAEICFTADWLDKKRKELKGVDPSLLERALHAFALLGHLAESDLKFVFKGGTSLLLHVPVIRRLSIDIDILCSAPTAELDRVLAEAAKVPPFIRYEEDERGSRGLPERRHFKFFYTPLVAGNPAPYVFLDVVEEPHVPHEVTVKPIMPDILEIRREILVTVPTVESLLADKLTAFAPRTTGVPFAPNNGKPADTMQIVKQLFDVGELFSLAEDLAAVRRVYQKVYAQENVYRGGGFAPADALEDTLQASLSLSMHRLKGVKDSTEALMLEDGARKLTSHLVDHRFNLDMAKLAAAKAALTAKLVKSEDAGASLGAFRTVPPPEELRQLKIEGEWERLNRLMSVNPEAFWYWYQASKL